MIEAEMADGTILEFPEGTDPEVIKKVAKEYAAGKYRDPNAAGPPPTPPAPEPPKTTSAMDAFVQGGVNSALLDWGDEAVGAIGGVVEGLGRPEGFWNAYERTRDQTREWQQRAAQEHPEAAFGGTVAGAVGSSLLPGGYIAKGGSLAKNMLRAGTVGAGMGGVAGAGRAETMADVPGEALEGAAIGGAVGTALPYVGNKMFGKDRLRPSEYFKNVANKAYADAEAAGATLTPQAFQKMTQRIIQKATAEGADEWAHPQVYAVLRRMKSEATNEPGRSARLGRGRTGRAFQEAVSPSPPVAPGFDKLETYRRMMNDALLSQDKATRRLGNIIKNEFDDFLDNVQPSDILSGNSQRALNSFKVARSMYQRKAMIELVETIKERAANRAGQYSQSGLENAIRTEARQIAQNPKRLRQFAPAEQALIKRMARGGSVENFARWIGKLNPKGVVSAAPSIGAAMAIDPVTGLAIAGAGYSGAKTAEALTRRNMRKLEEAVRRGAPLLPYSPSGREAAITNIAPFMGANMQTYKPAPAEVTVGPGDEEELRRLEGLLTR